MSDQRDRKFVQHSIDTGLASMQGNPFLAQRIVNQERTEKPVMKKKISFALILAMILVAACVATAVAGATNEAFNAWLYQQWPDLALTLMPVNMSSEDCGIRVEVVSAAVQDSELYINYLVEDLEGNRIDEHTHAWMAIWYETPDGLSSRSSVADPQYDAGTGKLMCSDHYLYEDLINPGDNQIEAFMDSISSHRKTTVNLLPLLKEYGSRAKPMPLPENIRCTAYDSDMVSGKWEAPESMHVLDNTDSPEIPLADHVYLSGIGMVDGILHVQIHYPEYREICDRFEEAMDPLYSDVYLYDTIEDELGSWPSVVKYHTNPSVNYAVELAWENNGERWVEYMFTVDKELTEEQTFGVNIDVTESVIKGDWRLSIPLRLIRNAKN